MNAPNQTYMKTLDSLVQSVNATRQESSLLFPPRADGIFAQGEKGTPFCANLPLKHLSNEDLVRGPANSFWKAQSVVHHASENKFKLGQLTELSQSSTPLPNHVPGS